jgi:hypothetical protein
MSVSALPLVERIRIAGFNLMVARTSHDIWWLYAGNDTRRLFIEGMQPYSEFFRYDQAAHQRAMIVGLYTLFDGRRDTITLESLIDDANAAGYDVDALTPKLAALSIRVAKIKVLRHKLFAHRDHSLAYNEVFKAAEIRPSDLRMIFDESLEIVNGLAALTGAPWTYWNDNVANHTTELLYYIQRQPNGV